MKYIEAPSFVYHIKVSALAIHVVRVSANDLVPADILSSGHPNNGPNRPNFPNGIRYDEIIEEHDQNQLLCAVDRFRGILVIVHVSISIMRRSRWQYALRLEGRESAHARRRCRTTSSRWQQSGRHRGV
jgi:hypothetical protein